MLAAIRVLTSSERENENEEDVQDTLTQWLSRSLATKKEQINQDVLEKCRDALQDGHDVPVRLTPEPENPFDSRAIAFMCLIDSGIGLVVVLEDVHQSLSHNNVTSVKFSWMPYMTHWHSGFGFYARVNSTKRGYWAPAVVRSCSTK